MSQGLCNQVSHWGRYPAYQAKPDKKPPYSFFETCVVELFPVYRYRHIIGIFTSLKCLLMPYKLIL